MRKAGSSDIDRSQADSSRSPVRRESGAEPPPSPIPDFLRAFRSLRHQALEPFLDEEVVYHVEGFDPIGGRRSVLAYWRRMFEVYEAIGLSLSRHVRDAGVVIAAQRQLYFGRDRPPLVIDSLTVYELADERIRAWTDRLQGEVAEVETALWRRLRTARW